MKLFTLLTLLIQFHYTIARMVVSPVVRTTLHTFPGNATWDSTIYETPILDVFHHLLYWICEREQIHILQLPPTGNGEETIFHLIVDVDGVDPSTAETVRQTTADAIIQGEMLYAGLKVAGLDISTYPVDFENSVIISNKYHYVECGLLVSSCVMFSERMSTIKPLIRERLKSASVSVRENQIHFEMSDKNLKCRVTIWIIQLLSRDHALKVDTSWENFKGELSSENSTLVNIFNNLGASDIFSSAEYQSEIFRQLSDTEAPEPNKQTLLAGIITLMFSILGFVYSYYSYKKKHNMKKN